MFLRAIIIVLDGLGVGELPDAAKYGDAGSNTLNNVAKAVPGLKIPNLVQMGLGNIEGISSVDKCERPIASFGRMAEASPGKDTMTGHWEMMGVRLDVPFSTFPDGFPPEIMDEFRKAAGRGFLGNRSASGTAIIEELGPQHMKTGDLIVYTSADSVFQVAAHVDVVSPEELYGICEKMRSVFDARGDFNVGRVIARPFKGAPGAFERSHLRKDFSVEPPRKTLLDHLKRTGQTITGIGKIGDIFCHRGLTHEIHTEGDMDGVDRTIEAMKTYLTGLIFTNLVDFDTVYGHRNDPVGYASQLEAFDARLPEILDVMNKDDILFITGDHGCDPTTPSTDHSREYVPVLVYGKRVRKGINLGTRKTFADLGATVAEVFWTELMEHGTSFLGRLK